MPEQQKLLNGWLILDKPLGITSAQAVSRVKRLLNPKKIGHGGTLDPLASGVLPLALGEATKVFDYVAAATKSYRFTVQWGEERDTDDGEGKAIQTSDLRPTTAQIEAVIPQFIGKIEQVPPIFSAIKVDGKRSYDRARKGQEVQLAPRIVEMFSLKLLNSPDSDHSEFEMTCGKGTYVRAIARDLGRKLGCFGYVTALRRTRVGKFTENRAISLAKLEQLVHSAALEEQLLPIASVLDDIPALELDLQAANRLRHGQTILLPEWKEKNATVVLALCQGTPVAITSVEAGVMKSVRVFVAS